jgi:Protein of unknown function (DUF1648)
VRAIYAFRVEIMRQTLQLVGIAALALLGWITGAALYGPNHLPDRVPTHFDAAGHPNAWGSPTGMLLLPVVAAGLYLLMSLVTRYPGAFHYPVRVTRENIEQLQSITLDMIAWLKVENTCLFLVLQSAFIQAARTGNGRLFPMILPFFIAAIFGTIGWHILALFRAARA